MALVVPAASPFKTAQDFAAALKADPTKVPVAGGSAGGSDHILLGMIGKTVGVPPTRPVLRRLSPAAARRWRRCSATRSRRASPATASSPSRSRPASCACSAISARQAPGRHRRADAEGTGHRRRAVQLARRVRAARRHRRGQGGDDRAGRRRWRRAPPGQTSCKKRDWTSILLTGDDYAKFVDRGHDAHRGDPEGSRPRMSSLARAAFGPPFPHSERHGGAKSGKRAGCRGRDG